MLTQRLLTLGSLGLVSCGLLLGEDFEDVCPPKCDGPGGTKAGAEGGAAGDPGGADPDSGGTRSGGVGAKGGDDSVTGGEAGSSGGVNGSAHGGTGGNSHGGTGHDSRGGTDGNPGGVAGRGGRTGGGAGDDAGAGGSPDDGEPDGGDEIVVVPFCTMVGFPSVAIAPAAGLGVSLTWEGDALQAYVSRPSQQILVANWERGGQPGSWGYWICFDAVPRPNRVSATNLLDYSPEIFVTTMDGQLFVRRQYSTVQNQWGSWWAFDRPRAKSRVSDVHVVGAQNLRTRLYVTDSGYVYRRERSTDDTYAPYGPWRRVGTVDAAMITAGITIDGGERIFVTDSYGTVLSAKDPTGVADEWNVVPTDIPVRDLDVGYGAGGYFNLYVLGTDGSLKRSSQTSEEEWAPWQTLKDSTELPDLISISVYHFGTVDRVLAIGPDGKILELEQGGWRVIG